MKNVRKWKGGGEEAEATVYWYFARQEIHLLSSARIATPFMIIYVRLWQAQHRFI